MTLLLLLLVCAGFRADYLPAARKLEQAYSQCRATVNVTVTNDQYLGKTTYEFALDGKRAKFDRTIEENGEFVFRRVVSGTPDLSFMILTKDNSTILEHVDRSGGKYCFTTVVEQADPVRAAFAILGKPLSERLKTCQVKSFSRERLDFADVEPDGFTIDGWVRFLPDWRIDRSEFNLKRGNYTWRRTEQVNYRNGIVASVDAQDIHPERTNTERYVVDLDFGPVPASEFKLSHYGYDDRIGAANNRRWLWVAVAAAIVVIATLLLARPDLWASRRVNS